MAIVGNMSIINLSLHLRMGGGFWSLLISELLINNFLATNNLHLFIFATDRHMFSSASSAPIHLKVYVILASILLCILINILLGVLAHFGPWNVRWVRTLVQLDVIEVYYISRHLPILCTFANELVAGGKHRALLLALHVIDLRVLPLQTIGARVLPVKPQRSLLVVMLLTLGCPSTVFACVQVLSMKGVGCSSGTSYLMMAFILLNFL